MKTKTGYTRVRPTFPEAGLRQCLVKYGYGYAKIGVSRIFETLARTRNVKGTGYIFADGTGLGLSGQAKYGAKRNSAIFFILLKITIHLNSKSKLEIEINGTKRDGRDKDTKILFCGTGHFKTLILTL